MATFEAQTEIAATPQNIWEALGDIGNIYQWNPGAEQSRLTTEQVTGVGTGRHCISVGRTTLMRLIRPQFWVEVVIT